MRISRAKYCLDSRNFPADEGFKTSTYSTCTFCFDQVVFTPCWPAFTMSTAQHSNCFVSRGFFSIFSLTDFLSISCPSCLCWDYRSTRWHGGLCEDKQTLDRGSERDKQSTFGRLSLSSQTIIDSLKPLSHFWEKISKFIHHVLLIRPDESLLTWPNSFFRPQLSWVHKSFC